MTLPSRPIASKLTKPNLLLCFDAFGTLFSPKSPVAEQYALVAHQCGITNLTQKDLESHLFAAIKEERKNNPNYGNATGLGATQWWTNIIHKTFTPFLKPHQQFPSTLVPTLLHRFASNEGYKAESDLVSCIRQLKHNQDFNSVIIGVVTNSDDRVPSILSSFGLNVSPHRYGEDVATQGEYDIDFHCMSYDVGAEKPDERIFRAAESMVSRIVPGELDWQKLYVGDDYAKDVVGAHRAGWDPVLLDVGGKEDVVALDAVKPMPLKELFGAHKVVKVRSLKDLAMWLTASRV